MGRKALADNIKLMQGTLQKCRQNENAPKVTPDLPEMPETLSERAVSVWGKIAPMLNQYGVVSSFDQIAIENLCETYAEWLHLNDYINNDLDNKTSYETVSDKGGLSHRAYPEIAQRATVSRRLQSLLSDFGLTPAARSKVNTITKDKKEDPWKDL